MCVKFTNEKFTVQQSIHTLFFFFLFFCLFFFFVCLFVFFFFVFFFLIEQSVDNNRSKDLPPFLRFA